MKNFAIIVAGGTGSRMGHDTPKQFLLLAGKPLLMHSIEAFYRFDAYMQIIVSLHPDFVENWRQLCKQYEFQIPHQLAPGGETRFHSVQNSLKLISGSGLVAVHDAARPNLSVDLINRVFTEAARTGNAIPCIPVNETVRIVEGEKIRMIDRTSLRITQTPEVFESGLLKRAYEQPFQPGFTDDGSLLEVLGMQVCLVEGDPGNMKITLPGDIEIAEVLMKRQQTE